MKLLKNFFTLFVLSAALSSCADLEIITASRSISNQEHFVGDYNGLEVASAIRAEVTYSTSEESIMVEANSNLHQYIQVDKINGNLRIKLQNGVSVRGNYFIKVHITTGNELDQFSASGASSITVHDKTVAEFVGVNLSGASHFKGAIEAQSLSMFLGGASNATISGVSTLLNATLSGASLLHSYDMATQNANFDLSGASNAQLTVNGTMDIEASGGSVVMYKGTGLSRNVDLSGGSQLIRVN